MAPTKSFLKKSTDGEFLKKLVRQQPDIKAKAVRENYPQFSGYGGQQIGRHINDFKKEMKSNKGKRENAASLKADDEIDADILSTYAKKPRYESKYEELSVLSESADEEDDGGSGSREADTVKIYETNPTRKYSKYFDDETASNHIIFTYGMPAGATEIRFNMPTPRRLDVSYFWPDAMKNQAKVCNTLCDESCNKKLMIAADSKSVKKIQDRIGAKIPSVIIAEMPEDMQQNNFKVMKGYVENNDGEPKSQIVLVECMAVTDPYHLQEKVVSF